MDAEITDGQLVKFTLSGQKAPEDAPSTALQFIDEHIGTTPFGVLIDARHLRADESNPSMLYKTATRLSDVAVGYDRRCVGAAFVSPSVLRASLGSVLRMKSWEIPHAIFGDESAAADWLLGLIPRADASDPVQSASERWLG